MVLITPLCSLAGVSSNILHEIMLFSTTSIYPFPFDAPHFMHDKLIPSPIVFVWFVSRCSSSHVHKIDEYWSILNVASGQNYERNSRTIIHSVIRWSKSRRWSAPRKESYWCVDCCDDQCMNMASNANWRRLIWCCVRSGVLWNAQNMLLHMKCARRMKPLLLSLRLLVHVCTSACHTSFATLFQYNTFAHSKYAIICALSYIQSAYCHSCHSHRHCIWWTINFSSVCNK